jgi:rubrerythrin
MLGFSIPKLLLLLVILIIIWNLFKFLEKKSKSRATKEKKSQFEEESLTECNKCGCFYDKTIKKRCPICTNAFNK